MAFMIQKPGSFTSRAHKLFERILLHLTSGFLSLFYHSANLPNTTVKECLCWRKYHMNIIQLSPPDKTDIEREIFFSVCHQNTFK